MQVYDKERKFAVFWYEWSFFKKQNQDNNTNSTTVQREVNVQVKNTLNICNSISQIGAQ